MEHHATVDKGLKMKIKKKKCDNPSNETPQSNHNAETHHHLLPQAAPRYHPSPSASEKAFHESKHARKDRHKHDKAIKHTQNNFLGGKYESSFMPRQNMTIKKERTGREMHEKMGNDFSQGAGDRGLRQMNESGKDGVQVPPLLAQEATFGSNKPMEKAVHTHDPYDFNSRDEDKESICSQGGLLAGLSAMKLKTEKVQPVPPTSYSNNTVHSEDETRETGVGTCSFGMVTDPDCLGPCEPGTSVVLEGIVWNETENGILVVNVTWRGKTYVGTLMDATRHDWAPPRFSCDSPVSDFESKTPKGRGKRSRLGITPPVAVPEPADNGRRLRQCRRNAVAGATQGQGPPPVSPAKHANGKRKPLLEEIAKNRLKRSRTHSSKSSPLPGVEMIECPEPDCSKKYKHINGLRYHQSHAHKNAEFANATESRDCEDFEPMINEKASNNINKDTSEAGDLPLTAVFDDMTDIRDQPIDTEKMDTTCDHEVANLNGCLSTSSSKVELLDCQSERTKDTSKESSQTPVALKEAESTPSMEPDLLRARDSAWTDKKKELVSQDLSRMGSPSRVDKATPPPVIPNYPSPLPFPPAKGVAGAKLDSVEGSQTLAPPSAEEAHSPAYSDISDANEGAPLLENEAENLSAKLKHKEKYDESSSEHSGPEAALVAGYSLYSAYNYGQPPYLTPVVNPDNITRLTKSASFDKPKASPGEMKPSVSAEPEKQMEKPFLMDQPYGADYYKRYQYPLKASRMAPQSAEGERDKVSEKRGKDSVKDTDKDDLSSKARPSGLKDLSSHQPSLNKSGDGTFQILKENMQLKEQLRDSGMEKKPKDDLHYLGKQSDFKRFYSAHQSHVSRPGIMDSHKNAARYAGDSPVEVMTSRGGGEPEPKDNTRSVIKSPGGDAFHGKDSPKEKPLGLGGSQKRPGHPPGVPGPAYSSYQGPYFATSYPSYVNSIAYDSSHPMMMPGYPSGPPFMHPHPHSHPMRFHGGSNPPKPSPSPDGKGMGMMEPHSPYYSGSPGQHRHDRESVNKPARHGEGKEPGVVPAPGDRDRGPISPEGEDSSSSTPKSPGSGRDEPPVQRHLHSHHHTHVVGPAYPLYGPYGSIL